MASPALTSETHGRTRLSFANLEEIDEFAETLARYERGELTPDQWRTFRLVRGTYGQRQAIDAQMIRVKIPQGILDGPQLQALADVADRFSRGFGHVTTRQNVQFHFVKLHDVEHVMTRLAKAGLTTREACGSAVRNVTACPYAGVAADEAFDVTPYAEALTRYFLRHPLSASLPRKFKVALEGCREDHALTAINDLGFRAELREGVRGFRIGVAGGTSILPKSGAALFDFLPAGEILDVAEAVIRVFHRLGDYKHKQRNRLKFLIRDIGYDAWHREFEAELVKFRAEGGARLPFDPEAPPVEEAPSWNRPAAPAAGSIALRASGSELRGPGIRPEVNAVLRVVGAEERRWRKTNMCPQKQGGYAVALVTLPLGDFTSAQMRILAELAASYGDGTLRLTNDQNLLLRWVRVSDLGPLYARLLAASLGLPGAATLADVTSCPGAEACRLAVTQSRGLGRLLSDELRARPDLADAVPALNIKISGCPNGCGQHHVAGLGFQGSVRKLGERVIPQYFVMLGGGVDDGGAHFGRLAAKIPARRVTAAVERLVALYVAEKTDGETPVAFLQRVELGRVKTLLADLEAIAPEDARPADYVDLGDEGEFKIETLEGECSA